MERKRPTPKSQKRSSSAAAGPLALILVDGAKIRQKIKRAYERVRRDLAKAREDLDRFHGEDAPSYSRWISRQFGVLLVDLRETTRRIRELKQLFREIEVEIIYNGASEAQAYARVMQRREDLKEAEEAQEEQRRNSSQQENGQGGSGHSRQDYQWAGAESDPSFGFGNIPKSPHIGRTASRAMTRLKELYRALVRRLHPDTQKEITPEKQEWWHQVQTAYETGDIEKLESILNLCELEDAGTTSQTSLSVLQRISAQLKKTLQELRKQLAVHKLDPAWNFSLRKDLPDLEAAMRRQMNHDLAKLQEQLQAMEQELNTLATQSQRRRAPRRRQPLTDVLESLFE